MDQTRGQSSKYTNSSFTSIFKNNRKSIQNIGRRSTQIFSQRHMAKVKFLSRVRLFATPWTVAYQAPLSMGFSRQQYWSGLPCPSPGDLPDPGIKPRSPALQTDALPSQPPGKSKEKKSRAPGIPRRSPIQVLTRPDPAQLPRSDKIERIQDGVSVEKYFFEPLFWGGGGKNTGMGCHSLRQESFPTQGLNPGLTHCRQMLYRLSHQGSPYDQKAHINMFDIDNYQRNANGEGNGNPLQHSCLENPIDGGA